jgi:hypothetical protein
MCAKQVYECDSPNDATQLRLHVYPLDYLYESRVLHGCWLTSLWFQSRETKFVVASSNMHNGELCIKR